MDIWFYVKTENQGVYTWFYIRYYIELVLHGSKWDIMVLSFSRQSTEEALFGVQPWIFSFFSVTIIFTYIYMYIYMYICIYVLIHTHLEAVCPLFLGLQPSKRRPFPIKTGSFGFQIYLHSVY